MAFQLRNINRTDELVSSNDKCASKPHPSANLLMTRKPLQEVDGITVDKRCQITEYQFSKCVTGIQETGHSRHALVNKSSCYEMDGRRSSPCIGINSSLHRYTQNDSGAHPASVLMVPGQGGRSVKSSSHDRMPRTGKR